MCRPAGTAVAPDLDRAAAPEMCRRLSVALPYWIEHCPNRVAGCRVETVEYQAAVVPVGYPAERVQQKVFLRL